MQQEQDRRDDQEIRESLEVSDDPSWRQPVELPHHEEVRDETFDIDQDRAQCRGTVLGPDDGESGDSQRQAEEPENLSVSGIKWPIRQIEEQRERRHQQDDVEDGHGVDDRNAHGHPDRHRGCNERDHQKDAPLPDRITDLRSGRPRTDRPARPRPEGDPRAGGIRVRRSAHVHLPTSIPSTDRGKARVRNARDSDTTHSSAARVRHALH
jgi:hypothetical protein